MSDPMMNPALTSGNGHDRIHRFAGTMHRAIDSIEHRLSSAGGGMSSTQARYGEQARQYGDRLRTRMNDQPLQTAGISYAMFDAQDAHVQQQLQKMLHGLATG